MKGDACNWSPRYTPPADEEETTNAYTVVWLMGYDDGNGVVKQTHVYMPNRVEAQRTVEDGELKSCEGRVLAVLRGHLEGGS